MGDKGTSDDVDPIALGTRLREARRARGLTQDDVARKLGVSRPTLIAVEQGRRRARPAEIVALARMYGRDVSQLVHRAPPLSGFVGQFRLGDAEDPSHEKRPAVDELQQLAESIVALEQAVGTRASRRYPLPYDIEGLGAAAAAEQVADSERRRLGLGDGPLPQLREILENDVGLLVFAVPMPARVAALFGYAEPAGGCVAINARHPHERQRWSLAHEYAHFLTTRYAAEVSEVEAARSSAGERFADAFAGHFLMPALGLTRRYTALRRSRGGGFSAGDLLQLAALYEVSAQAMALRLENLRLLASGWWKDLRSRKLRVDEARGLVGLQAPPADVELLPLRYRYLAAEAYCDGTLSEGQLAKLLRMDRLAARVLVQRLVATAEVGSDGGVVSLSYEPSDAVTDDATG
jgi:Zn-dependent peptidase ImmA (M78 family)/DNA-binding XRE family transcriptional regulator